MFSLQKQLPIFSTESKFQILALTNRPFLISMSSQVLHDVNDINSLYNCEYNIFKMILFQMEANEG